MRPWLLGQSCKTRKDYTVSQSLKTQTLHKDMHVLLKCIARPPTKRDRPGWVDVRLGLWEPLQDHYTPDANKERQYTGMTCKSLRLFW